MAYWLRLLEVLKMLEYPDYSPTGIVWAKSMPAHWKCDKAKRFFLNPKVINKMISIIRSV